MSEKVDIWMPLYVAEWDLSTGHLTNEQDGAYGRLVRWYWREGGPPSDDDEELASIVRVDVKTWRKSLRPKLAKFFDIRDGKWWHSRVEATIDEWAARREKASIRASKGAAGRWGNPKLGESSPGAGILNARDAARKPHQKRGSRNATSIAPSIASGISQAMHKQCPSPSSTVEEASYKASSLCERDAPILPHEGQSARAPVEDRKAIADAARAALGIRPKGRRVA
jgi:uncharacterized protein YdaU (DUF1376 family)